MQNLEQNGVASGALCGPMANNFYDEKQNQKIYQQHKLIEFRVNLNEITTASK